MQFAYISNQFCAIQDPLYEAVTGGAHVRVCCWVVVVLFFVFVLQSLPAGEQTAVNP
jgi:hypothetical protein